MKFLLHGPDTFRMRRKFEQIRAQFVKARDAAGMNVSRLRAGEHSADDIAEAFFTSPFLAEKKMVVLEGFLSLPLAKQEGLADLLQRKPESTVAVFIEEAEGKDIEKSPLYPLLASEKHSERFPTPTSTDLERFCVTEAAAQGLTINPSEARLLATAIGDDLPRLHGELMKVCAYALAAGKTILDKASIAELIPEAADTDIFGFVDACTRGDCRNATTMLENLLQNGYSEHHVVAMLERQFRLLVAAAEMNTATHAPSAQDLGKALGVHHFPAGKALTAVRTRPYDWYLSRHTALLDLDRKAKSGATNPSALLNTFIASLTH